MPTEELLLAAPAAEGQDGGRPIVWEIVRPALPVALLVLVLVLVVDRGWEAGERERLHAAAELQLEAMHRALGRVVEAAEADVRLHASQEPTRAWLRGRSSGSQASPARDLVSLARAKPRLDSLRILDLDGSELLAVRRDAAGEPVLVPAAELKAGGEGHPTSEELAELGVGIRVSRLNLDTEDDGGRRPLVHLSARITAPEGAALGFLVIDLCVSDALSEVHAHAARTRGGLVVLDEDSRRIRRSEEGRWLREEGLLSDADPELEELWRVSGTVERGRHGADSGTLVYHRARLGESPLNPTLLLAVHLDDSVVAENIAYARKSGILIGCVALLGLLAASTLRARSRAQQRSTTTALRTSERRHRGLVETIPHGVVEVDLNGVVRFASDPLHRILGYRPGELVGRFCIDLIAREAERKAAGRMLERVASGELLGQADAYVGKSLTADGRSLDVRVDWAVRRDAAGEVVGCVALVADISDSTRMERALLQKTEELEAVYHAHPDLQIHLAQDGTILDHHAGDPSDLHLVPEELTGRRLSETLPPAVGQLLEETLATVAASQLPRSVEYELELGKGRTCFEARVLSIHGEDFLVIARNITARKEAEEERERLEGQLRQSYKMEALGQLAGGVAHDFNNILTVITGHAQLLRERLDADDPRLADLSPIDHAAQHAASLTRQLLAFSRQQVIRPRWLDLNQLIDGMRGMLRRLLREDIVIEFDQVDGIWAILADAGQAEQVLLNLVLNAHDAMAGGGVLTIATSNRELTASDLARYPEIPPGLYVRLAVCDTGSGFDSELGERIFEPFFTTKPPGQGTGLGLASVYGIVRQSKGLIRVQSEPEQGTCFYVYFPASSTELEPLELAGPSRESLRGGETLIVCEDDESVRQVVQETLTGAGYQPLVADGPKEALELEEDYHEAIHILISDVVMPEMTGFQLARELRERRPGLGLLFVSGYPAETLGESGGVPEDAEFLQKPFSPRELLSVVREILDRDARENSRAGFRL